jgi:hypothetical protein
MLIKNTLLEHRVGEQNWARLPPECKWKCFLIICLFMLLLTFCKQIRGNNTRNVYVRHLPCIYTCSWLSYFLTHASCPWSSSSGSRRPRIFSPIMHSIRLEPGHTKRRDSSDAFCLARLSFPTGISIWEVFGEQTTCMWGGLDWHRALSEFVAIASLHFLMDIMTLPYYFCLVNKSGS